MHKKVPIDDLSSKTPVGGQCASYFIFKAGGRTVAKFG